MDRSRGTYAYALAAVYTFVVAHVIYIHFTFAYAKTAIDALGLIELDADEGDLVKKSVYRAKRAEKTAEKSVNEDRQCYKRDQKREFPRKKRTEHDEQIGILNV